MHVMSAFVTVLVAFGVGAAFVAIGWFWPFG